MKKKALFCAAVLLLCALCAGASANSWGLTGRLLTAVSKVNNWNDYTCVSQAGDFAVMHSQYHNALFWADAAGALHVYTTAVYQPDDQQPPASLALEGSQLTLRYGQSERYTFAQSGGEWQLLSAQIGSCWLGDGPDGLLYAQDAAGSAFYTWGVPLNQFNIRLLPHSTAEARAVRMMNARLDSGRAYLDGVYSPDDWGQAITTGRTGNAPVYSAPYGDASWRAAKGKAAVGLNGEIWLLNTYLNADGESWAMIRYDVSPRTQRIGYARCRDLGLQAFTQQDQDAPGASFARVEVTCAADTYLTDDPDVSQFKQVALPKGTQMTCMGIYNDYYAYVGLEVNGKDQPADGGAILWGFVPIRDLTPDQKPVRQDVMAELAGYWHFNAGGNMADDYIQFNADGTFTAAMYDWTRQDDPEAAWAEDIESPVAGTWYVTDYNAFENLYFDRPPYELTMIYENGRVNVKGLTLTEDGFGLTYWEGGGGYVPVGAEPEDANG